MPAEFPVKRYCILVKCTSLLHLRATHMKCVMEMSERQGLVQANCFEEDDTIANSIASAVHIKKLLLAK